MAAAALRLLDEEGPAALSVRRVAAELGVMPNAIYTYVPDRSGLERSVVELVLSQSDLTLLDGAPSRWRRRVRAYAVSLRTLLLDHPGVALLLMSAPMDGPTAVEVGERLLGVLADGGLGPTARARGVWLLIVHVLGSVALDVAETDGRRPLASEADRVAGRRAALAFLDEEVWPRSVAAADVQATWITEEQFLWGLDRILDGLAATTR
ncbi:MAG TPA: TetR/AcrR family transcriptional regulator [Nocardioides sp.]|nr:TetR/AcrR family transcriptional regulator [Nocardioides sp.]